MDKAIKFKVGAILAVLMLMVGGGRVYAGNPAVDSPPHTPPAGSSFNQRLEQRKKERNVILSKEEQTRLVTTCLTGQAKVRLIERDMVTIMTTRTKTYQRIDAKLWTTIGQLKLADKDTFDLENDRLKLADKTAAFQVIAANFTQTMDDIQVINCAADLPGFKALVDTTRIYYTQLQAQSADSRDYIVNTIKPELDKHISDLQAKTPKPGGN